MGSPLEQLVTCECRGGDARRRQMLFECALASLCKEIKCYPEYDRSSV